jgi:ribose transport system substrate-binding protein
MPRTHLILVTAALLPLLNCGSSQHSVEEKYYLVSTNIKVQYWQQAFAGLNRAGAQLQVKTEQVGPDTYDPKGQHEEFLNVLKQKPSGILVSASDPKLLKGDIDAAIAQGVPVITIDADAPESKRLTFIGTDNYKAGVMGARVVASRLQGKGNVVVYTMPEQANLKDRLRGYTDVFEEHPQIKISEVIDIKGDPRVVFDRTMEMIEKHAKVDAFVCLVSIAAPEVSEVLARNNVTGKVVLAMDTDQRTLEGIQKGFITATVAQKPFTMAYLGVKALDDLHHHPLPSLAANFAQDSFSPLPVIIDTGATMIDKGNVEAFIQQTKSAAPGKQ